MSIFCVKGCYLSLYLAKIVRRKDILKILTSTSVKLD